MSRKQSFILRLLMASLLILSISGCSMSIGGSSPQKKPEASKEDIKKSVEEEMQKPETKQMITDAAKTQKLEELLQTPDASKLVQQKLMESLETPEVDKKIQENLKTVLSSPETQKQLQLQVTKAMDTPAVQQALNSAVQQAMMKMLQGGGGQGGGGQGGGQGGGSSGGGS